MKVFVLFAAAALLTLPAVAQERKTETETQFPQKHSAQDLLLICASSSLTVSGRSRRQYCAGFVSGVEETLRLMHRIAGPPNAICVPARVSARHLAEVYVKYAAKRERDMDKPAVEVVVQALTDAYPCPPP